MLYNCFAMWRVVSKKKKKKKVYKVGVLWDNVATLWFLFVTTRSSDLFLLFYVVFQCIVFIVF